MVTIMKKFSKITVSIISVVLMAVLSLNTVFAETYFEDDNFRFVRNGNNTIKIVKYINNNPDMEIPEKIFGDTVVEIAPYAFLDNKIITTAQIPNTVTKIGDFSFGRCENLESIVLPFGLNSIGFAAFQECTSLKSIEIQAKLDTVPDQAFFGCASLESIELPDTVQSIGSVSFGGCEALKYVTIPKSTTYIAFDAFKNSSNVTIRGYKDSFAEEFALEFGINFEIIPEYEIGDVDLNGIVNISDATLIQQYAVSIKELSDYQLSLADVNGDGVVNVLDATQIQRILVGFA